MGLFGPIVSGFYAGMTTKTYRSMVYVCLATSTVAGLYFGTVDRLPYLLLGEMVLVAVFYLAFFLAFLAMGLISAIAVRRVRREVLRRAFPVSH